MTDDFEDAEADLEDIEADDSAWLPSWSEAAAASTERDIKGYAPAHDLADVIARARAMDPDAVPAGWDEVARDVGDPEHAWLPAWGDAVAASTELEITRYAAVPDLADVLARSRAMDPNAVPADWDDLARDEAGVMPLAHARALHHNIPDAGVALFATALRGHIEQGIHERQLAAIPDAPRIPRRRRAIALAAVSLAAAAVLVWFAGPRVLARYGTTVREEESAAQTVVPSDEIESWTRRDPEPTIPRVRFVAPEPVAPPEPPPATEAPPRRLDLDAVEREALVAWRANDLATAERLLLRIAKSGRSARAELAYGDLFSIARQRRGTAGQVAMWRAYLQRFPRGRFAEDARAGVCRRADDPAIARDCWSDYLRDHPSGAHAAEAKRWQAAP